MAEKRKEFVKLWISYESYFEAFSDVEVGRLVRAMMKYRVSREEPKFNGNERFIWPAIRRDIDESLEAQELAAEANRENGKKGGRPPKTEKANWFTENPKNPFGFFESEKSHGQGQGHGHGQGHGQGQGQDMRDDALSTVMSAYMSRINPTPSPSSMDDLKAFVSSMGSDVCLKAIDTAVDAGKASWSYVRAILRSKQQQGVKSLADWNAMESRRGNPKQAGWKPGQDRDAPDPKFAEQSKEMRRIIERMREEA